MSDNTITLIIDKHPSNDGTLTIHVDDGEYGTSGEYSVAASIGVIALCQMDDENAMSLPDAIEFDDVIYKDLNQLAIAARQRVRDLGGDAYWDEDNPIITLMEPIKHPKDLALQQWTQGVIIKLETGINQNNGKLWLSANVGNDYVSENERTISDAIGKIITQMMLPMASAPPLQALSSRGRCMNLMRCGN